MALTYTIYLVDLQIEAVRDWSLICGLAVSENALHVISVTTVSLEACSLCGRCTALPVCYKPLAAHLVSRW